MTGFGACLALVVSPNNLGCMRGLSEAHAVTVGGGAQTVDAHRRARSVVFEVRGWGDAGLFVVWAQIARLVVAGLGGTFADFAALGADGLCAVL